MKIIYDGSMGEKELRNIFRDTLIDLVEKDPTIVYLDADLMGCMGTGPWAKQHPDRAINCGIAEADMVGIACGMAAEGYRPIMHTFGPFASRRCYDQLFLSAGYAGNDVTVVGGDPGVCAALNGGTHMPFEDTALFRLIPGSTIVEVTDYAILESVMRQLPYLPGVKYIRVDRKKAKPVYEMGGEAPIGKGIVLREGADITIIASGIMVQEALEAAKVLEAEGIEATVVDMFTVKPLDTELVLQCAEKTGAMVVAENHNRIGGLCSAVADALVENGAKAAVEFVAVFERYGEVGTREYLQEACGLTAGDIVAKARKALARK
ncbi:MAG: transketolase family protein [Oscillibacter sp.]|nr:transketolase family protein [Oscillibacter sp.]